MSGGRWDYIQYAMRDAAGDVSKLQADTPEARAFYKQSAKVIMEAAARLHSIDWCVSGDTCEKDLVRYAEKFSEGYPLTFHIPEDELHDCVRQLEKLGERVEAIAEFVGFDIKKGGME